MAGSLSTGSTSSLPKKSTSSLPKKSTSSLPKKSTSSVPKKPPSPESSSQKSPPPESSSQKKIMIKVKSQQDGGEDLYKIGENAPLKKLMTAYCVKKNLDLGTVRFIFKKKGVKPKHTPSQLKMENNDIIDTVTEQGGGGPYNA